MNVKATPMNKTHTRRLALAAMFMAVGMVLPFLTGQIQQIGNMLLPMHLPVLLCGMICGWRYGAVVGFALPLLRSLIFGMPPMYPNAASMAVELEVYGLVAGAVWGRFKDRRPWSAYIALVPAMLAGRAAWGVTQFLLLGIRNDAFTWQMFAAGAFVNAVPGIILQLLLIPAVMNVIHYTGVMGSRDEV